MGSGAADVERRAADVGELGLGRLSEGGRAAGERRPCARGRKEKWAGQKGTGPGGKEEQAGLGWLTAFSKFLSFFFSSPFETQIYLNSHELLNSNPVHSFQ
jgi:hypothetical protein